MKLVHGAIPTLAVLLACSSSSISTSDEGSGAEADVSDDGGGIALKVMTYNLLCSFCNPSEYDPWEDRLAYFGDIFERHDPDVIGLQEIAFVNDKIDEVAQVAALVPGYSAVYFDSEAGAYPDATILYRKDRFELLDKGFYWLSPTPDEPFSIGFADELQFPRIVAWVLLKDRESGFEVYFVDTHFDNNSPSQERSAPLVLERTAPLAASHPVVFVGDFNSKPDSEAYGILVAGTDNGFHLDDTFDQATEWKVVGGDKQQYDTSSRIDHIFVGGGPWICNEWLVDMSTYGPLDRYPSDHFPVVAEIETAAGSNLEGDHGS